MRVNENIESVKASIQTVQNQLNQQKVLVKEYEITSNTLT